MLWTVFASVVIPVHAILRVGFLSDDSEDKVILNECVRNSSIELVTLPACHNYNGLENVARLHYDHQVNVLLGSPCNEESETVSRLAFRWGIPFISTSVLSSQDREATTLAMVPDYQLGLARATATLLNEIEAKKVTVIYTNEFHDAAIALSVEMGEHAKLVEFSDEHFDPEDDMMGGVILFLVSKQRREEALEKVIFFSRRALINTKFVVYDDGRMDAAVFFMDLQEILDELTSDIQKQIILANFVLLQSVHGSEINTFASLLNSTVTQSLEQSLLLCDAISLLAGVTAGDVNLTTIFEKEIHGFTGPILFSKDGARQPYFTGFTWENDELFSAISLTPSRVPCNDSDSLTCIYYDMSFDSNSTVLLSLRLVIGDCEGGECGTRYTLLAALVVFGVVGVPLVVAFQFQRREREIHRMPWRIAYESVLRAKKETAPLPGYRKISSTSSAGLSNIAGFTSTYEPESSPAYLNDQKVFVKTYRQKRAVNFTRAEMKQLNLLRNITNTNLNTFIGMSFNQSNEMMVIWKYCSRNSLDHIIFEKNQRFGRTFQGSFLKHILNGLQYIHNSQIQFHGSLFLSNCVVDAYWVVRLTDFGVQQIIWDKMEHKELESCRSVDIERLPTKYYQLPPEVLRPLIQNKQNKMICCGSQKADIYQLGMVIYQILYHTRPFSDKSDMTSRELVTSICHGNKGSPCYPSLPDDSDYSLRLTSIMQQCWSTKLDTRPALYAISDAVAREFEKEGKGNIIDQMLRIIDDYQENLETKICERTKHLEESLVKTENLLFHIMPRKVAEDLRQGIPICSVMHPSVSLMLADVCKFTELCESCIPVHIIDILQDLYSSFDKIVSRFQAFKVENVGDNYMLVSGLDEIPYHLAEVCKIAIEILEVLITNINIILHTTLVLFVKLAFSLDFLPYTRCVPAKMGLRYKMNTIFVFVSKYEMKHRKDMKLQVKIGINCGAVASGILGSSAPRFCLFGDTVNMACRMAALSEPGRIHITEGAANQIRNRYQVFTVEERGLVEVKVGCDDFKAFGRL
ncbi:hypothetical protein Y032_0056g2633 [Ancylostoma ceylanicum]|uniref:guanylate cyclase n=1 Tax=Ancylostoma ceylanicum TaxID=53326 RepID=A0A016U6L2_9BILA|nr:hypothetical protein Y032_0056g2633 [Ancylostoma ceylanicum]